MNVIKLHEDRHGFVVVWKDMLKSGKLDLYEKAVFIALKSHCNNETMQCFPSLATIAEESGVSVAKTKRVLNSLEEKGVIAREQRKTEKGDYTSTLYTLYDTAATWTDEPVAEVEPVSAVSSLSDDELLAEAIKRGLISPDSKKSAPSVEDTENIVYMEKASVSPTVQSDDTDTLPTNTQTTDLQPEVCATTADNCITDGAKNSRPDDIIQEISAEVVRLVPQIKGSNTKRIANLLVEKYPEADQRELHDILVKAVGALQKYDNRNPISNKYGYLYRIIATGTTINGDQTEQAEPKDTTAKYNPNTDKAKAFLQSLKEDD